MKLSALALLCALSALLAGCNYDEAFRAVDSAARSYYTPRPAYTPVHQPSYSPPVYYPPTY